MNLINTIINWNQKGGGGEGPTWVGKGEILDVKTVVLVLADPLGLREADLPQVDVLLLPEHRQVLAQIGHHVAGHLDTEKKNHHLSILKKASHETRNSNILTKKFIVRGLIKKLY
jgi:hypothetical protein